MMDDTKIEQAPAASPAAAEITHPDPTPAPAPAAPGAEPSAAVAKFQSCRWRCDKDLGAFCTHRDVLPFAGKEGFNADSWCPECAFFKLRRTPKKRERVDYSY